MNKRPMRKNDNIILIRCNKLSFIDEIYIKRRNLKLSREYSL